MKSLEEKLRLIALSVALLAGPPSMIGGAYAQTPSGTQPTPDPTPAPPFHSPFNGDQDANGTEASAFARLEDLFGKMRDAQTTLNAAKKCGTAADVRKAQKTFDAADKALEDELVLYSLAYANAGINAPALRAGNAAMSKKYAPVHYKIMDALGRRAVASKPVGACPTQPGAAPQPVPPGTPPLPDRPEVPAPLPPCDDGNTARRIADTEKSLEAVKADLDKTDRDLADEQFYLRNTGLFGKPTDEARRAIHDKINVSLQKRKNLELRADILSEEIKRLRDLIACPVPSAAPQPPPSQPDAPEAKPEKKGNVGGLLRGILGNVTIGVGAGGENHPRDTKKNRDNRSSPSSDDHPNKSPPPKDSPSDELH